MGQVDCYEGSRRDRGGLSDGDRLVFVPAEVVIYSLGYKDARRVSAKYGVWTYVCTGSSHREGAATPLPQQAKAAGDEAL